MEDGLYGAFHKERIFRMSNSLSSMVFMLWPRLYLKISSLSMRMDNLRSSLKVSSSIAYLTIDPLEFLPKARTGMLELVHPVTMKTVDT